MMTGVQATEPTDICGSPAQQQGWSPTLAPMTRDAARGSWLHIISHLHPKYGGVSAVLPPLTAAIAQAERYSIQVAAFCAKGEDYVLAPSFNVSLSYLRLGQSDWREAAKGKRALSAFTAASSGLHIHGLWQRSTALAASHARQWRKPYIISAHGMLEQWALRNKRWKKQIYLALIERANLNGAACLHALTGAEVEDYRRLGLRNPVAIIPNGVELPPNPSADLFLSQFPELIGKRIILFLGRIHYKKGLDILCQAWSRIAGQWPEAQLVLAGPDSEGTQAGVSQLISRLGLSDRVSFTGLLTGESKWSALAAADFFVLPSYSEGLSVSILEALGIGKPVLITENCNFPQAEQYGCGTVVRASADQVVEGLEKMLRQTAPVHKEMGRRGEQLIRSRYSWPAIGAQMSGLYRWLEGGPRPADVEFDFVGASR